MKLSIKLLRTNLYKYTNIKRMYTLFYIHVVQQHILVVHTILDSDGTRPGLVP